VTWTQAGFTHGRYCANNLWSLRQVAEQSLKFKVPLYCALIDYKGGIQRTKLYNSWTHNWSISVPINDSTGCLFVFQCKRTSCGWWYDWSRIQFDVWCKTGLLGFSEFSHRGNCAYQLVIPTCVTSLLLSMQHRSDYDCHQKNANSSASTVLEL